MGIPESGLAALAAFRPAGAGDSGYFPRGIVPGRRRRRAENSGMTTGGLLGLFWGLLREGGCVDHGSGHSAPCRLRRDGTRRFWFGGFFHTLGAWERHRFNGGAVAVCFEGCCGGMCWPADRPATHAAAGAAARGALIFCFGDCFTRSGVVRHACRHRVTAPRPAAGQARGLELGRRCWASLRVVWRRWRRSGPLAREIPDIFRHGWRRAGKFRNDDGGWGRCFRRCVRMNIRRKGR